MLSERLRDELFQASAFLPWLRGCNVYLCFCLAGWKGSRPTIHTRVRARAVLKMVKDQRYKFIALLH